MVMRQLDGHVASLDYREKAPLAATRDMYLDERGNVSVHAGHNDAAGSQQVHDDSALLSRPAAFCILRVTPATGTILFGIRADHASVPPAGTVGTYGGPSFSFCDESYWRNPSAMQAHAWHVPSSAEPDCTFLLALS